MNELIEELLKLQIRQTEIIGQLIQGNATESEPGAGPQVVPPDNVGDTSDRPLRIGDRVRILNTGRIRIRRDTVYTVTRIGKQVTSTAPNGSTIVRAAHNLKRV